MPSGPPLASRFRILKLTLALESGREQARDAFRNLLRFAPAQEWDSALPLLARHGVAPYAAFLLTRDGLLEEAPESFAAALKEHHRESQIDHFRHLGELRRLAGLFRGSGIRAIPFKGAALFTTLYDRPGLRPMQDQDWLVHRVDLPRAELALREAGYVVCGALDAEAARRLHFHLSFQKIGGGTRVELHWNLADERSFPPERLEAVWAGVRESTVEPFLRLDPLTTLVHLCVHAFKHGSLNPSIVRRSCWRDLVFEPLSGNRLIWLLDIRKLLSPGLGIPPGALITRAQEWGMAEAVAGCLHLAQEVFGPVRGWEGAAAAIAREPLGPKRIVLDLLTAGLARESPRAVAALERLQRLDHTRELRLIRAFDLLDLALPRPGESWRWQQSGRGRLLPLLYLYRALASPVAIARKALPWLRRGG